MRQEVQQVDESRMSHYDSDYYGYTRPIMETWYARNELLRPDQLAVIAYLYGTWYWGSESWDGQTMGPTREPKTVISMGAGRGEWESILERMGVEVIGVDPSPGAREHYKGQTLVDVPSSEDIARADSIVWCQSLEHMTKPFVRRILDQMKDETLVVIVNWVDHFPLEKDGGDWDHITRCDEDYYNKLAEGGEVILHRGSHLVLRFGRV